VQGGLSPLRPFHFNLHWANVNTDSNTCSDINANIDSVRIVSYSMHRFNHGKTAVDVMITNDYIDVFLFQEH